MKFFKKLNIIRKADEHEFKPLMVEIEDEPTSPLGRLILWSLFAFMLIAMILLTVVKVDVVITGRGIVVPDGEIKIVQPLEGGIINSINVKVGDFVKKGDVIMEIDPSVIEPDFQAKKENLERIKSEIDCLENYLFSKSNACNEGKYIQMNENMVSQINSKKYKISQLSSSVKAAKDLLGIIDELLQAEEDRKAKLEQVKDLISMDEYKRTMDTILNLKREKINMENSIATNKDQIKQINYEIEVISGSTVEAWQKEYADLKKSYSSLKAEVEQASFRNQKQNIYAPVDGYVNQIFINTVGGVVTPAQQLVSIVPAGMDLVVKTQILNKDIGYIEKDQPSVIKVDTYDFQKYGKINGAVYHISPDSIDNEQLGRIYEVYVKPENLKLFVEGKESYITSGMSVTTEIKVGKRRVIEFFIYPAIKYLDEGLSIR